MRDAWLANSWAEDGGIRFAIPPYGLALMERMVWFEPGALAGAAGFGNDANSALRGTPHQDFQIRFAKANRGNPTSPSRGEVATFSAVTCAE